MYWIACSRLQPNGVQARVHHQAHGAQLLVVQPAVVLVRVGEQAELGPRYSAYSAQPST
jgi:hypothetical protein